MLIDGLKNIKKINTIQRLHMKLYVMLSSLLTVPYTKLYNQIKLFCAIYKEYDAGSGRH